MQIEVPAAAGDGIELHVVFHGGQCAVAKAAELPGYLRGAEQVDWADEFPLGNGDAGACFRSQRAPADAAGVDHGVRGAAPAHAPAVGLRPWGSDEDLLALHEEQALFGKEGFRGGEVDDHVVGLDGAEVGVDGAGELKVGRRAPEQVHTRLVGGAAVDSVMACRHIGKHVVLLARVDLLDDERLHVGHERGAGERQRRPSPALLPVADAPDHVGAETALQLGVGHGQHAPGNHQLRRPAGFRAGGGAAPGPVPLPGETLLRQYGAVVHGIAQAQFEPVPVTRLPRRVQHDAHAVAVADEYITPGQPLDDGFLGLVHLDTDVQAFAGIEKTQAGSERRGFQRIGRDYQEIFLRRQAFPHGLVQDTVNLNVRITRGNSRQGQCVPGNCLLAEARGPAEESGGETPAREGNHRCRRAWRRLSGRSRKLSNSEAGECMARHHIRRGGYPDCASWCVGAGADSRLSLQSSPVSIRQY